jgi:RimJ/RimL family protein N-acetyltransferase
MRLEPRTLRGGHVTLEPLAGDHKEELKQVLDCDPQNWETQYGSAIGAHFEPYWDGLLHAPRRLSLLVRHSASGAVAGTSSYLFIDPMNRTLEIGGTWLRPEFRGTSVNPEMKMLMLEHAFTAGCERVQFTVDTRNSRSQNAMLKLGATKEGVIRRHLITWTGHKRDSVLFSIIADEWAGIRDQLLQRLRHE